VSVMDERQEIRLRDVDGCGEMRVTVWRTGEDMTFRFAIHSDADDDREPSDVLDVSAEDVMQLVMAAGGTAVKFLQEESRPV
jgi:hypothetical protein